MNCRIPKCKDYYTRLGTSTQNDIFQCSSLTGCVLYILVDPLPQAVV